MGLRGQPEREGRSEQSLRPIKRGLIFQHKAKDERPSGCSIDLKIHVFEIAAKAELALLPGKAAILAPFSIRGIQLLQRASGADAARASFMNEGDHRVGPLKQVIGRRRNGGWRFEFRSPFEHATVTAQSPVKHPGQFTSPDSVEQILVPVFGKGSVKRNSH